MLRFKFRTIALVLILLNTIILLLTPAEPKAQIGAAVNGGIVLTTRPAVSGSTGVFTSIDCGSGIGNSNQVLVGGNPCAWTGSPSVTAVTTSGDLTTSAGNVVVTSGTITSSGNILTSGGNITATAGNIVATAGILRASIFSSPASTILSVVANVIAPTGTVHHLGAGVIKTITVPATCTPTCSIDIIPDAGFTYDATGNIVVPSGGGLALINKTMRFTWDGAKWNPSY